MTRNRPGAFPGDSPGAAIGTLPGCHRGIPRLGSSEFLRVTFEGTPRDTFRGKPVGCIVIMVFTMPYSSHDKGIGLQGTKCEGSIRSFCWVWGVSSSPLFPRCFCADTSGQRAEVLGYQRECSGVVERDDGCGDMGSQQFLE